jgi:ketosteroid isomerase-like protein
MSNMPEDFDRIAIVVDWLDACRKRDLVALLGLYADDANLQCTCDGNMFLHGRAALEAYWRPRFKAFPPAAFGLEEITPTADGVVLDYSGPDGRPVRISFAFSAGGKIRHTNCAPSSAISRDDCASPPAPAG